MADRSNPYQTWFFLLGFVMLAGCVIAGLADGFKGGSSERRTYDGLCVALGLVSSTFFALATWIHVKS